MIISWDIKEVVYSKKVHKVLQFKLVFTISIRMLSELTMFVMVKEKEKP